MLHSLHAISKSVDYLLTGGTKTVYLAFSYERFLSYPPKFFIVKISKAQRAITSVLNAINCLKGDITRIFIYILLYQ